jgi:vacuolar protein sorting-associated protein 52
LRNEIGDLHTKVGGCIEILSAFEKLLNTFQGDLSNISDDIKNMQDQSMEKNIKINNRKVKGRVENQKIY